MSLLRNSSEIDEFISIEIPFICIWIVESFERIERFVRIERISDFAISIEWSDSGRAETESGTISERVWLTTSSLRRCFQ